MKLPKFVSGARGIPERWKILMKIATMLLTISSLVEWRGGNIVPLTLKRLLNRNYTEVSDWELSDNYSLLIHYCRGTDDNMSIFSPNVTQLRSADSC